MNLSVLDDFNFDGKNKLSERRKGEIDFRQKLVNA